MANELEDLRRKYRCCYCCDVETAALIVSVAGLVANFLQLQPLGIFAHAAIVIGYIRQNPKWYWIYTIVSSIQCFVLLGAAIFALFLASFGDTKGSELGTALLVTVVVTLALQIWFIDIVRRAKESLEAKQRLQRPKQYFITLPNTHYAGYYMPYAVQSAAPFPSAPPPPYTINSLRSSV